MEIHILESGLKKITPHRKDFSLIPSFGSVPPDVQGLPKNFSSYDGRQISNQNALDGRFIPAVRPLPMGCTAETATFDAGIQDGQTYLPDDFYFATPPGTDNEGRDIREALKTAVNRGFRVDKISPVGNRRTAYFNCYGSSLIEDFDAVRLGIWLNKEEKRGVSVGSYWYWHQAPPSGILPAPSLNPKEGTLHNYLATGWKTIENTDYLEVIPWLGMEFGDEGKVYISRFVFNQLMTQPWSAAFTMTKLPRYTQPVTVGFTALLDHVVYWIREKFRFL